MNSTQKRYAIKRVDQILHDKTQEAKDKYQIKAKTLSNKEKYALVKKGLVILKPFEKCEQYGMFRCYDFSSRESNGGYDRKLDPMIIKLETTAQEIKDDLMLGTDQEALDALKKLEQFKV